MALLGGNFLLGGTGVPLLPKQQGPAFGPALQADFADPLGVDVACYPDLDAMGSLVSGKTMLGQAIARRLTTPRGALFYDTNYGTDLRLYISEGMTTEAQGRIKAAVESECLKDERVAGATATVGFSLQAQTLKISIALETKTGPFSLTIAVTSLTVSLLTLN